MSATLPARPLAWLRVVLLLAGTAACIGIVAWQLLVNGAFAWHVQRPAFTGGGAEALALGALLAGCFALPRRGWRLAGAALVTALYLRRHAVDVPLLLDGLYLESMFALGALVLRGCGQAPRGDLLTMLQRFVLGFCVWSLCAWTLSALGAGSVRDLRWLTLALIVAGIAARAQPWSVFVEARIAAWPRRERMLAAVLLAWFLVSLVHSATAIGYDARWYGLRGDRVLVGAGSVFAAQGLVSPVYYFPKLYELFLIPVSGLGSAAAINGMSVFALLLTAAAAWLGLAQAGLREHWPRLLAVALVVSLPAFANSALVPKADIFIVFLLGLGAVFAMRHAHTGARADVLWCVSLALFAPQAKLSAIPYSAALLVALAWVIWQRRRAAHQITIASTDASTEAGAIRVAWCAACLMLVVSLFSLARTWWLVGVPTIGPEHLLTLWQLLGMTPQYPVGTLRWEYPGDWAGVPLLLFDLLFRPQQLVRIQIAWTGNVFLCLGVLALLGSRRRAADATAPSAADAASTRAPAIAFAIVGAALMLAWHYDVRGGDGNYYALGVGSLALLTFSAAWRRLPAPIERRALGVSVCAFALFQAAYALASTSWQAGTRELDADFGRSWRSMAQDTQHTLDDRGLAGIATHLRGLGHAARVVSCTEFNDSLGWQLPGSVEDATQLLYSHVDWQVQPRLLYDYLRRERIEYLVAPLTRTDPPCPVAGGLLDLVAWLDGNAAVPALRDRSYVLYDIRAFDVGAFPGRAAPAAAEPAASMR